MLRSLIMVVCCFIISVFSPAAHAERGDPVYVASQNPWIMIFGLPKAESGAITTE
ncbi:MAG: hypothetical protein GY781_19725, partial [Gammaproteobacteria bacterium]|nr:hypothetical protein [Gammaproteobacteria bacterium]